MKKRGLFAAALAGASLIFGAAVHAGAADITIMVNGSVLKTQTPAVIENSRTLVPLRAISEGLGCDVAWDADTRGITVTDGSNLLFLWIGRDHIFKTTSVMLEDAMTMDAPPVIMNDYTMVPLRVISEMFGAEVGWDAATYTVSISYPYTSMASSGLASRFSAYEQVLDQKYDAYRGYVDGTGSVVNAEIQLEDGGNIELELYPDIAPITVANFVKLANEGFYNGLIFHRVIEGFVIQGGGYDRLYNKKESAAITGEFIANGYFNLIPHEEGVISMARTSQSYDSASSQFFIMHEHAHSLDGQYAAFGKVTSGMEYVNKIAGTETGYNESIGDSDVPIVQQVIKAVVIK